jgi:hypothetical protein
MESLFKRIETGQYVAFSTVFTSPYGPVHYLNSSALFSNEDDAALYLNCVYRWHDSLFPSCCVGGCGGRVVRELVSFDGVLVHAMSGRTWQFARVETGARAFAHWRSLAPTQPSLEDCEELARAMDLPYTTGRLRCLPCLRDVCCILDVLLCCLCPKSIPC